ncbi:secretin N-terminal domain-containing protein [Telluria sp. Tellsp104]
MNPFFVLRSWIVFLTCVVLLAGCAAERLHRDGLDLIAAGKSEEGLRKLGEASAMEPGNAEFRMALLRQRAEIVTGLLTRAARERAAHRDDAARALYQRVQALEPADRTARTALDDMDREQRHAGWIEAANQSMRNNDADAAQAYLHRILLENAVHPAALALQRQIDEQRGKIVAAGTGLNVKFKRPVSLQFRDASLKVVFESLSRASGINVLIDKEVKADTKISIFVKDVAVADAVDLILLQTQLEKKVVSDNTVLVYQNTPAKLKEFQDLKIRSFHLVNADAKQLVTMIKALLRTKDIFVHEKTNSIVMRDTPDVIELAARLVDDQDIADPEVMLEVEVLEVSGSRLSELGVNYPSSATFSLQGTGVGAAAGMTIESFRHINGDNIVVTPAPSITLNLLHQDGTANLLASPRIRARNHEKAKVMIGDRVPVITNAITPVSTGTPVVTGNVQYLDVGLKLEVEPEIHLDNDVSIKVNLEVSSIVKEVQNTVSGTLAYQVGTRNATTVLRLKDGETQILAGLINDEDRDSASRIPGLGSLPVVGRLFSSRKSDLRKTEIVLSITPHVVGSRRSTDARSTEFWAGTEASPRSGVLMARSFGVVETSARGGRSDPHAALVAGQPSTPPPPAVPAGQPVVLTWQGPNQAKVGDRISIALDAQSTQALKSLSLSLEYDPAVLRALDVTEGNFMTQSGAASQFNKDLGAGNGVVALTVASTAAGSSGAGTVATAVFEVVAPGATQVRATHATAVDAGGADVAVTAAAPLSMEAKP